MKRVLSAIILFSLVFFVSSCVPKTELSVSPTALTFDNQGGNQTVPVTANKTWTATSSQSWCKVTPSSGDGSSNSNVTLSVSCDPNTTYDSRSCSITIVCEELTAQISVTQAEGTGLVVSQTDYSLTNEAQTVSIEVKSNVDYLVSVESDATSWIQVQSTKGLNSGTIVLAVSENKDYDSRTGKVTVKEVSGSLSQTITIRQGEAYGLFLTKPEYDLSNESHTLTVEVKANVSFDVVPQVEWIKYVETKGLKTSQIVLEVAANDTYDAREGQVLVRQTGGALSETITIRQEASYGLFVTQTAFDLSDKEQTIEVEVKFNVDFDVVIPSTCKDWIIPLKTKDLTTRNHAFRIKRNEGYERRTGSITFKQKDGALSGTVTVRQAEAPGLIIPKTAFSLSGDEQELVVNVQHNVPLEVVIPDSCKVWINALNTKGLTTDEFHFLIRKNDTEKERKGSVQFKQKGGQLSKTVTIKQAAAEYILVDPDTYSLSFDEQTVKVTVWSKRPFKVSTEQQKWIHMEQADDEKAPEYSLVLQIDANEGPAREGVVEVYTDYARQQVTIRQQAGFVTFDDPVFKALCVKEFDEDEDGEICFSEAKKIRILDCHEKGINSLLGLEHFQDLRYLNCAGNELARLDLSGNAKLDSLRASDNQLKKLDVSKNPLLRSIAVDNNQLASLNLRKNPLLEVLSIRNNQLAYIYFDNNPLITVLSLDGNKLTSLEVVDKLVLTTLDVHGNQLTSTNISNNPKLTCLSLEDNQLASLGCKNCPALETLLIGKNPLESLNLAGYPVLQHLNATETLLETIDLRNNTKLIFVELKDNPKLKLIRKRKSQHFDTFTYDKEAEVRES